MFSGFRRLGSSRLLSSALTFPIISADRAAEHSLAYNAVLQRNMRKADTVLSVAEKRRGRFSKYLNRDRGLPDDGMVEFNSEGEQAQQADATYASSRAYVCKGAANAMASPPYFSPSVTIPLPARSSRGGITFPEERKLKLGVSVGVSRDDHRINRTWLQTVRKGFRFGVTGTFESPTNILQGEKPGFRVGYMHNPEKLMAMHLYVPMQELQRSMNALGKYMTGNPLEPMEWDYLGMHALNMVYSSAQNIPEREKRIRYVEIYLKQLDREFNAAVRAMSTQPYSYLYMDKINEQYRSMRIAAEETLTRYRDASKSAPYSLETLNQHSDEYSHASDKQREMANRYFNRVSEAKNNFSAHTQADLELCQIAEESHSDFQRRLAREMTDAFENIKDGTPEDLNEARFQIKSLSQQSNRRNIKAEIEEILKTYFEESNLKNIDAANIHAFFDEALNFDEANEGSDEEDVEAAENAVRDLANILKDPIIRAQNPWLNELVYAVKSVPDVIKIGNDLQKANRDVDTKSASATTKREAADEAKTAYDTAKSELTQARKSVAPDKEQAVKDAKKEVKESKEEYQKKNTQAKEAERQLRIAQKVQSALVEANENLPQDISHESCKHNILKALHHAPHKSVTYRNVAKDAFHHLREIDGNKGKFMQSDIPYFGAHIKVKGITIGLNPHPQNQTLISILQTRNEDTRETQLRNYLMLNGISDIRVDIPKANTQKYHQDYVDAAKAFVHMLQWLNGYGQKDAVVNLESFSYNDSFRLALAAYCHVHNINCNPLDKDDICASIDAKTQKTNIKLYEQYVKAFEKDLHEENRNSKKELGVPEEKRPGFFKSVGDAVRRGEAHVIQKGVDVLRASSEGEDPFGQKSPRPGKSSDDDKL